MLENEDSTDCYGFEVGLTWVTARKVSGGQSAACLGVDVERRSRLLSRDYRVAVGLELPESL